LRSSYTKYLHEKLEEVAEELLDCSGAIDGTLALISGSHYEVSDESKDYKLVGDVDRGQ